MDGKWLTSFQEFAEDIGEPPFSGASLDRIDNDKGYEPGNIRWASKKIQQRNMRSNHLLVLDGAVASVSEWAERLDVSKYTLFARLRYGWSDRRILTTPVRKKVCKS